MNQTFASLSRGLCVAAAATLLCTTATAQLQKHTGAHVGLPTVAPEVVGLSAERLDRITEHFQGYIDRKEASGALALIARKGKVGYFQTWGDQNRESGKEMTGDTIFRIYSMSKPITSVALMSLYEEGRFSLNDPISKFLPEFKNMQVLAESRNPETGEVEVQESSAERPITFRDVLRHTAGLTYGIFGDTQVDQKYREANILASQYTLAETISKLGRLPLQFQPATKYHYSVAVDVSGRLVEVISGEPFDEFLNARVFQPLGMNDTFFRVPPSKRDRFAQLYTPKGSASGREVFLKGGPQTKEIEPINLTDEMSNYDDKTVFLSGGGGLASTAEDYWRFCQMMLDGGRFNGSRILSRKTVELMTSDHLGEIQFGNPGFGFGLGFSVVKDIAATGTAGSDGTYAWGGAAGTKFWIDPEEDLIGIFMVQILPHRTRMGPEFQQLVYQTIDD